MEDVRDDADDQLDRMLQLIEADADGTDEKAELRAIEEDIKLETHRAKANYNVPVVPVIPRATLPGSLTNDRPIRYPEPSFRVKERPIRGQEQSFRAEDRPIRAHPRAQPPADTKIPVAPAGDKGVVVVGGRATLAPDTKSAARARSGQPGGKRARGDGGSRAAWSGAAVEGSGFGVPFGESEGEGRGGRAAERKRRGRGRGDVGVAPVMDEHKTRFFCRRLAATCLGGSRLCLESCPPCWVTLTQVSLLITPALSIAVPLALKSTGGLSIYAAMALAAGLIALCAGGLVPAAGCCKACARRDLVVGLGARGAATTAARGGGGGLEEDAFDFDTCGGAMELIVAGKAAPTACMRITHSAAQGVLACVLAGLCVYYLDVERSKQLDGAVAGGLFVACGLASASVVLHPLLFATPAEPNQISPMEYAGILSRLASFRGVIGAYTRAVYAFVLIAFDYASRAGSRSVGAAAARAGRGIFATLFVGFAIGALPQLDVLLVWATEQALVIGFGRSPTASVVRLGTAAATSGIALLVAALVYAFVSETAMVVACATLGYALAHDTLSGRTGAPWFTSRPELYVCAAGLVIGVPVVAAMGFGSLSRSCQAFHTGSGRDSINAVTLAVWVYHALASMATRPYILRLLRNPFYSACSGSGWLGTKARSAPKRRRGAKGLGAENGDVKLVVVKRDAGPTDRAARAAWECLSKGMSQQAIFAALRKRGYNNVKIMRAVQAARKHQNNARQAAESDPGNSDGEAEQGSSDDAIDGSEIPRWLRSMHPASRWATSVWLVVYVGLRLEPNRDYPVLFSMLTLRAATAPWQSPWLSLDSLALIAAGELFAGGVENVRFTLLFLLASLAARAARDFAEKLEYCATLTVAHLTNPKLRVLSPGLLAPMSVGLLPIHLAVIALCTAIQAPVVPVFGLPFFLPGFPRALRTLPGLLAAKPTGKSDASTPFYEQMLPGLSRALAAHLGAGVLRYARAGDFFLLRQEPYLLTLQVLERGARYAVISVKGLEMQTTSCHTVEANSIDRILEDLGEAAGCRNPHPVHTAQPVGGLRMSSYRYTSAKMTGVVDNAEFLKNLTALFLLNLRVRLHRALEAAPHLAHEWQGLPAGDDDDDDGGIGAIVRDLPHKYGVLSMSDHRAIWRRVTKAAYDAFERAGVVPGGNTDPKFGPSHMCSRFHGKVSRSRLASWLRATPGRSTGFAGGPGDPDTPVPTLFDIAHRAYCEAVKCIFDATVLGEAKPVSPDSEQFYANRLERYGPKFWFVGSDRSPAWRAAASKGFPRLFSIGKTAKGGVRSHLALVAVGSAGVLKLNANSVRSVWASLALELLYATNDDDERYSTQAHPTMLRNIIIQTADLLGYPSLVREVLVRTGT